MRKQKAIEELDNLVSFIFNLIENDNSEEAERLGDEAATAKVMYIDHPEPYYAIKAVHAELLEDIDRYNYKKFIKTQQP